jgi:hypothetical protein
MYRTNIKVLKDAGALHWHVRAHQTFKYRFGALTTLVEILFACPPLYNLKINHTDRFCMMTPHSEQ